MTGRPDAVLFDLFGTLIEFDVAALPQVDVDGRRMPSTVGTWAPLLDELLPGVGVAPFVRALRDASQEVDRERVATGREIPSRERFRRAIALAGRSAVAEEAAPAFARAHHRAIGAVTRFPPAHRRVLDVARERGPVAVVTNFDDTAAAYEILDRHGIAAVAASVVVSEAVGFRKPHPLPLAIALRDVGVRPEQALYVGDDAVADVGAAVAAGVDAAWIDGRGTGLPPGAPTPRWIIRALPDLEPLLG